MVVKESPGIWKQGTVKGVVIEKRPSRNWSIKSPKATTRSGACTCSLCSLVTWAHRLTFMCILLWTGEPLGSREIFPYKSVSFTTGCPMTLWGFVFVLFSLALFCFLLLSKGLFAEPQASCKQTSSLSIAETALFCCPSSSLYPPPISNSSLWLKGDLIARVRFQPACGHCTFGRCLELARKKKRKEGRQAAGEVIPGDTFSQDFRENAGPLGSTPAQLPVRVPGLRGDLFIFSRGLPQ